MCTSSFLPRGVDAANCYIQMEQRCLSRLSVTIANPAKTAEPIEMPLGRGLGWAKETCTGCEYWRHLANTTEPSVCGDDQAFCEQ